MGGKRGRKELLLLRKSRTSCRQRRRRRWRRRSRRRGPAGSSVGGWRKGQESESRSRFLDFEEAEGGKKEKGKKATTQALAQNVVVATVFQRPPLGVLLRSNRASNTLGVFSPPGSSHRSSLEAERCRLLGGRARGREWYANVAVARAANLRVPSRSAVPLAYPESDAKETSTSISMSRARKESVETRFRRLGRGAR